MSANRMRQRYAISAAIIACAVLLFGNDVSLAQEDTKSEAVEDTQHASSSAEEPTAPTGYQDYGRIIGTITDVDVDLYLSFPQKDSVFPTIIPGEFFKWKEDIDEKYGLKLGLSYQSLYQKASDTLRGEDEAWAGWLLFEGKWNAINRGEDYEGSLVATLDWRHTYGNKATPALFGTLNVGSLWPTDFAYIDWDLWAPVLYWEQWFKRDDFVLRVGNQIINQTYDFFRFKDPRVAFSGSSLNAPAASMPFPGPGLAATFEWWPYNDSELYVEGTVNDMNFETEKYTWDDALRERDFFYGLEVGYNWKRNFPADFDHLHLNLWYADKPAKNPLPGLPSEAGWGLKVLGEKQLGRFVGFGSYTYNTSEGGAFGVTFARHTVTAGGAYLKPLNIRGEIGLGATWAEPIDNRLRDQYGLETYWKILLWPNLWVTPGIQFIRDPSFNPQERSITIGQLKARLFF